MLKKLFIAGFILGGSITLYGQVHKSGLSIKDTITDRELTIPEDIERNFDQLLVDWKKNLSPSLSCKSNFDTDVAYPDSVYINRLYCLPTEMELVYNPVVRSYIDMYTGRMRGSVEYFLGKSDYYFPIFEQALDKYGLPLELKYLPIIESALNPTIASRMGATGLWQFMIGTGKMYDLEVNTLVDERRDPIKSTEAAARYLRDLHNIYGDWNLVIAAYNCGPGNVNKAIKRSGGQRDYWAIYPYLPKETRGYVPAFIAAAYVMNYYSEHNICPFEYKYTHSTDTILVDKQLHLQQVAEVLNVPLDELRTLNPQYKKDIVPGEFKSYVLNLPSMNAVEFELQRDSIFSYKATEFLAHRKVVTPSGYTASVGTNATRYKVRRGDNLASIANKYGVSSAQIKRWNGLKSNRLRAGQILAVSAGKPVENETPQVTNEPVTQNLAQNTSSAASTQSSSSSNSLSDYFSKLQEYAAGAEPDPEPIVEKVKEASTVDTSEIHEPQITENRSRDIQRVQTIYHKVRIGETLTQIASKYNVDRKDISSWNKLKSSVPKVGQRLVIHLPAEKEKLVAEEVPSISEESIEEVVADVKTSVQNNAATKALASTTPMSTSSTKTVTVKKEEVTKVEKKVEPKPKPKPKKEQAKQPATHVVKKGDTLGHIAVLYGGKLTPGDIKKANNLRSDKLSIGQKLKIPR
ncbi:LysM peptidoglycan-binding domain-containing protein [Dysgonomonas sp. HDW5A]|uniref:LysM peptidoglycan-binding domain-containing protein n=1 Tax=Dysgonomonas sp. HDW5A TaxID=2714926 RepID=UPI00140E9676|nr:LysM peptidoglycan-binding domain-containing protein [Dysgonomonas sp. HDW5A]QIK59628.1 LysM peptidoglycan-binding domain-containing protein [Dysgonomonas sp. HDW5A]